MRPIITEEMPIESASLILRRVAATEPQYITWREVAEVRRGTRCSPYDSRAYRWSYAGRLCDLVRHAVRSDVGDVCELIVRSLIVIDFRPIAGNFQYDSWAIEIGSHRPGIQRWHCDLMETSPYNRQFVRAEILNACEELDSRTPLAARQYLSERLIGVKETK